MMFLIENFATFIQSIQNIWNNPHCASIAVYSRIWMTQTAIDMKTQIYKNISHSSGGSWRRIHKFTITADGGRNKNPQKTNVMARALIEHRRMRNIQSIENNKEWNTEIRSSWMCNIKRLLISDWKQLIIANKITKHISRHKFTNV